MTTEQLARAHSARPFRPFQLRLADSRMLAVPHPEHLAYAPGTRTAAIAQDDGTFEIVDLLLVVGIEFPPAPAEPQGRRRRR
jgi:hypothetical protein